MELARSVDTLSIYLIFLGDVNPQLLVECYDISI